jgi:hypothetical protein
VGYKARVKATAQTIERFTAIADEHGMVFGEFLEAAPKRALMGAGG